jgi:GDP-L-fucose synthase
MVMQAARAIDRGVKVHIAGHHALVGSAIWRHLQEQGFTSLVGATSSEVDLRDREATYAYFERERPDVVIDAAARVGGILANSTYPEDFLSDNLRIQVNLMDAAKNAGVDLLLFLGSSCIHTKFAEQPTKESSLLTGGLEPTNDAHVIAKIADILQGASQPTTAQSALDLGDPDQPLRAQRQLRPPGLACTACPCPSLPRGEGRAARRVSSCGAPAAQPPAGVPARRRPRRGKPVPVGELDSAETINVGVCEDVTIRELAADVVGYDGTLVQDTSKPDGTPRKLLDVSKVNDLGWKATALLRDGIAATYKWFLKHRAELRGVA